MIAHKATNTRDRVRALQRALYRAAKANAARRFHALYDKVYRKDILRRAWREVKANAGAAGVDGQTITDIERSGVAGFLATLGPARRSLRIEPSEALREQ